MTGGTGLLPFVDLVDILFKRVKFLKDDEISQSYIEKEQPLVGQDLIKDRKFEFCCAAEYISDFVPLTLLQLDYLCEIMP